MTNKNEVKSGLDLLRVPFADNHISKLPKPTKAQTDEVKANFRAGIRCQLCGAWHHPDVVHLDYVGHAALTDRLLDADPLWFWEPVAFRDGLPAFDQSGGLWIKLTVCGVTRLGYGHAASKSQQDPGAREKEVIGDALRNAAMRFGAALDLWHKGDLHADEAESVSVTAEASEPPETPPEKPSSKADARGIYDRLSKANRELTDMEAFNRFWRARNVTEAFESLPKDWRQDLINERTDKAAELEERAAMQDDNSFPGFDGGYVEPNFEAIE